MKKDLETLRDEAEEGTIDAADLIDVARRLDDAKAEEDRYTMLQIVGEAGAWMRAAGRTQYRSLVERFLESPEHSMLARLALEILSHYWGEADRYLDQIRRFLKGVEWDDDGDVRQMAMLRAGAYLEGKADRDLLAELIRVVENRSEKDLAREDAYHALGWAMKSDESDLPPASRRFDVEAEILKTDLLDQAKQRLHRGG